MLTVDPEPDAAAEVELEVSSEVVVAGELEVSSPPPPQAARPTLASAAAASRAGILRDRMVIRSFRRVRSARQDPPPGRDAQ
jgi:hypothetical protein